MPRNVTHWAFKTSCVSLPRASVLSHSRCTSTLGMPTWNCFTAESHLGGRKKNESSHFHLFPSVCLSRHVDRPPDSSRLQLPACWLLTWSTLFLFACTSQAALCGTVTDFDIHLFGVPVQIFLFFFSLLEE